MGKRKETNTFKFQGFAERISNVKIDVAHRLEKRSETPDDADTFIGESLAKWDDLNCTAHYQQFSSKLKPLVGSFAQLIHHKQEVVSLIQQHLQVPNSLALKALLDCVVQLARDLQSDFYPHFRDVFKVLVSLLSSHAQDVEVLEEIFTALSYLFKFLWRYMVKDMAEVYRLYSPLLGNKQKPYIQQFAAESFGFLMRKTRDPDSLFDLLFGSLEPTGILFQGVGSLCFEMLKGVRKQFHSSTETLLPVMFSKLKCSQGNGDESKLQTEQVFQALLHMLDRMAHHTTKEHGCVVEKCLVQELRQIQSSLVAGCSVPSGKETFSSQLSHVLHLTDFWVAWKNGSLISQPLELHNVVSKLASIPDLCSSVTESLMKLCSTILLGNFSELSREKHRKQLIEGMLSNGRRTVEAFKFCHLLVSWANFTFEVLPPLLSSCQSELCKEHLRSDELKAIISILVDAILVDVSHGTTGLNLASKKGLLFFPKCGTKSGGAILPKFLGVLKMDELLPLAVEELYLVWGVLVCLPCMRPLDVPICLETVLAFIGRLCNCLESEAASEVKRGWIVVLSQAVQSLLLLKSMRTSDPEPLDFDLFLRILGSWPTNVHILQAAASFVSAAKMRDQKDFLSSDKLQEVFPILQPSLSSSVPTTRLLSLKILATFEQMDLKPTDENPVSQKCELFRVCLEAEEIPTTLDRYRDKLVWLQKLSFSASFCETLPDLYQDVALEYLISQLFINFSPLWSHVIQILAGFSRSSDVKHFWRVFSGHLTKAADNAEASLNVVTSPHTTPPGDLSSLSPLRLSAVSTQGGNSRADHANFRFLLWKAMAEFPEVVQQRSRDIVPLFFRFLSNEYFLADEKNAPTQDITRPATRHVTEDDQSENDDDEPIADEQDSSHKKRHKAANKSLCVHLRLFSLLKNPKAMYQEPKLRELYLSLLTRKELEIQKLAIKCLMAYKFDYLVPYKENFDRLLDDEKFRDELAHFSVDEENGVVMETHREGLVPILVRLLYGRMQRWTGTGTGGKAGAGARRSVVLRFLASCPPSEMKIFMDLILAPFKPLCDGPADQLLAPDLTRVVPLKKQQGLLNTLAQILHKLGAHVTEFLPTLLNVILALLAACVRALEKRQEVRSGCITQLKTIRQLAISRLSDIFEAMPDYDFRSVCDAIFTSAVWPQVDKLSQECIQHPTPLLKLLVTWSRNSRFFPLLSRTRPEHPGTSILSRVCACLHVPGVSAAVVAMVMEMVENLLSLADFEPNERAADLLESAQQIPPPDPRQLSSGTRLVLPHVSTLLQHIDTRIQSLKNSSARKKISPSVLPPLEMSVLSKLSPFVTSPEHSATLIKVLVPCLYAHQKNDAENNTLKTIRNLLPNVNAPSAFLKPFSRLFSHLRSRSSRQCLCDVFTTLGELDGEIADVASVVSRMNAWNAKRLDEPDYTLRLSGFSDASRLVTSGELTGQRVLPALQNCIHFVLHSEDLSVRDSAGSCLGNIVQELAAREGEGEFQELVMNCVVPACKRALKSKNEPARNEFLAIISMLVRRCDRISFSDMKVLTDADPEVDFFENIKHIQLHRRIHALRRLEAKCDQGSLTPSTLVNFLLPLATHCLHDYTSNKDHNLVTQAISSVGVISSRLPWSKYSHLLKRYLKNLVTEREAQKTCVRVVVSILNGFHFDLTSNSDWSTTEKPEDETAENGDKDEEEEREEEEGEETERAQDDKHLAARIYSAITRQILPQLHKCLTKKGTGEGLHRLSLVRADDSEELLRVPIALAVVKLLQKLPERSLQRHLPGLLLRVCNTLRSRSRDVRDVARDTLGKICLALGSQYFPFVLKELKSSLTRGYQLHVLGFTLHTLLDQLSPTLSPGDLDHSLESIVEVLVDNLFGEVANEREVDKIANKLPEAKSSRSYDSFEILGKLVGPAYLTNVVAPLKDVLDSSHSHKVSRKAEEVFRRVGLGLQGNACVTPQILLVFIHGLASESLPLLKEKKPRADNVAPPDPKTQPTDTFLLPANPVRGGKAPDTPAGTNRHIIVEFGLQLLYLALKRGKVTASDKAHLQMLDPFSELLTDCLKSKYTKVSTLALRCLAWVIKLPLPSLERSVPVMAKQLFQLLKKFARAGAKVGDHFELVLTAFKAMTVIIRDFKQYTIAEKHLQVLLSFVEEDIHDHNRQGAAFPLLKAILQRQLVVPEIHEVMWKVAQLSITGSSPSVQLQSRQCLLQFLLDYSLGKKLNRYLEFVVSQLEYEHETGRESALELLASMFTSFPQSLLFDNAGFFFIPLTSRLINDGSANCRQLTALAVKTLLGKLDVERRDQLFSITILWYQDEKVSLRKLAAQVCGLFVEAEQNAFTRRLPRTLPIIASLVDPSNQHTEDAEPVEDSGSVRRLHDHLLFNSLTTLGKILKECHLARATGTLGQMSQIWESVESHLLHPHGWVRLASSRLFGLLFAAWKAEELGTSSQDGSDDEYLTREGKVAQLCGVFCVQLESTQLAQELGEQVVKNLVFLAKSLRYGNEEPAQSPNARTKLTEQKNGGDQRLTLRGLVGRMSRVATHEASQTPKQTLKRSCVLRWSAALALDLGEEKIGPYLTELLAPVHRELDVAATYKDPELQKLAQEVLGLIREMVGRERFSRSYAELQHSALETRESRKRKKALEAVADPAKSARKKMKRNLSKKETRKRKIDALKPARRIKSGMTQESAET